MRYNIAGSIITIVGSSAEIDKWISFGEQGDGASDMNIGIITDSIKNPNRYLGLCYESNIPHILISRDTSDYLIASEDWSFCTLRTAATTHQRENPLVFAAVQAALLPRGAFFMHAALVEHQGRGILFTGKSGVGKSTQAELWARHAGARIINGDITLVKADGSGIFSCGTPWHGNSPHCENAKVPLKAIIALEQTSYNSLRRLSGEELFRQLLANIFLPPMVPDGQDHLLNILDKVLRVAPVLFMQNRADEESVHLLLQKLDEIAPPEPAQ